MTTTPAKIDLVTLTIDGVEVSVPKDTLVIRAAEQVGVQIPRFCDHPLLAPVGACRQCLVDIPDAGNGKPIPKPQASCTITVAEGMVVNTQATSPVADKAQQGDHGVPARQPPAGLPRLRQGRRVPPAEPGDVQRPRRDPLRRRQAHLPQADQHLGPGAARPRALHRVPALHPLRRRDRRRPVHRAGRARRPAADRHRRRRAVPLLLLRQHHPDLPGRRADQRGVPLPLAPLRPRLHAQRRRARRLRRGHPRRPPSRQGHAPPRRQRPRGQRGVDQRQGPLRLPLRPPGRPPHPPDGARGRRSSGPASWPEAFAVAARGLHAAGSAAVLTGGRVTAEDAYAYAKFARVSLGTNDIDFRARPHSAEEADFLASRVALSMDVTYDDLERASVVVLAGLEPEDEAATIFLRLRKASKGVDQGRRPRPLHHPRPGQDEGPAGPDRPRRRGRGAARAGRGRHHRPRLRRRHPRRRAAGPAPRRPDGGRRARPHHRRPARLGAPPCRRPRCRRGRLPADPAARRSSRRRRRRPGSTPPPRGASTTCPRPPAATATRSSPRSPTAASVASSSAAWTPTTPPTRPPPAPPSRPRRSWSASSSARPT